MRASAITDLLKKEDHLRCTGKLFLPLSHIFPRLAAAVSILQVLIGSFDCYVYYDWSNHSFVYFSFGLAAVSRKHLKNRLWSQK